MPKVRDAIRLIERDGWRLVRTRGSHRVFKHPDKRGIVVIAGKPGVDMPQGTWHNVLKQAGLSPNPPMDGARTGEGGKGVTGAMIRARIRVDGRLAGGLQALLGAPMSACSGCGERDGRIGHGKRRSRTGMA